jgi:hypothetical protein
MVAGAALIPLMRSTTEFASDKNDRLLRPPSALEESDFLARCVVCGECTSAASAKDVCSALLGQSFEGLWTPVVVPRIGYCEPSCVCVRRFVRWAPFGRLLPGPRAGLWASMPTADPSESARPSMIATAVCLRLWPPIASSVKSGVPLLPKLCTCGRPRSSTSHGNARQIKQPYLDPTLCVGCDAREYACPVHDRPGVYVLNIVESRSKTNQILLNSRKPRPHS